MVQENTKTQCECIDLHGKPKAILEDDTNRGGIGLHCVLCSHPPRARHAYAYRWLQSVLG